MKLYIFILILAALIQSSFLPINLVLILIISKALVNEYRADLVLSFFAGIFLGVLTSVNLGFYALVFLVITKSAHLIKRSPLTSNLWAILPVSLVLILAVDFFKKIFLGQSMNLNILLIETAFVFPFFILFKLWEERFIANTPLRLKI